MKTKTVSAIVPFYNEKKTIGRVVGTLISSPLLFEVICVDDGSTDGGAETLAKYAKKVILIRRKRNHGKGSTVAAGIKKARGTYVFFCDADLFGFTKKHIEKILHPVLSGRAHVVFGVPADKKTGTYGRHMVFLTGMRVYPRRKLLSHVDRLSESRGAGGSEIVLNTLFSKRETRIVPMRGLVTPPKEKKWSSATALKQYILSIVGVLSETGKIEIRSVSDLRQIENLLQVDTMESLRVRIRQIQNADVRSLLETYYARYLRKYVKKIKPPFLVA